MANTIHTFRDHLLSVFQSATEEIAHGLAGSEPVAGARLLSENANVQAAAALCTMREKGTQEIPVAAPPGIAGDAWECTRLAFRLLEARVKGDQAQIDTIESELTDSPCDPGWAETIVTYTEFFGPDGKARAVPYVRPDTNAVDDAITIPNAARIALFADWGTGTPAAVELMRQIKQQNPDILVHLGDVYYAGTPDECERNFRAIIDTVFNRRQTDIPLYNMTGNHDMYCGGKGFYDQIGSLNASQEQRQKASYFCLRTENRKWQLLGMDTGLNDRDPWTVSDDVTYLEDDEETWHLRRIAEAADGQTVLLSHHQLFSAFSHIGPAGADGMHNPCNPKLLASLRKFQATGNIAAWFWGHEHNLCIYQPYAGLSFGRCIGHSAVPVMTNHNPYTVPTTIADAPALIPNTQLSIQDQVFAHGFVMISLDGEGGPAKVEYFESNLGDIPLYTENIG